MKLMLPLGLTVAVPDAGVLTVTVTLVVLAGSPLLKSLASTGIVVVSPAVRVWASGLATRTTGAGLTVRLTGAEEQTVGWLMSQMV